MNTKLVGNIVKSQTDTQYSMLTMKSIYMLKKDDDILLRRKKS